MKRILICGIPHTVEYVDDNFDIDLHLGQVDYATAKIRINKKASSEVQNEALCHEVLHAMLIHIGRNDLSADETFVQSLGNAISRSFSAMLEE